MKKMYQKDWFGIPFQSFGKMSSEKLADSEFYSNFYKEFFKKYSSYDDLNEDWKKSKLELAEWIAGRISKGKVLSIGSGLSFMEKVLHENYKSLEVHVQDYASISLKWIQNTIPETRIHFVGSKISIEDFNIVFLSNVDYSISKETLLEILNDIQNCMHSNSEFIIMNTTTIFSDSKLSTVQKSKNIVKYILTKLKLYSKGQFWGWHRTPEEYKDILSEANLKFIEDGVIYPGGVKHYFIVAKKFL